MSTLHTVNKSPLSASCLKECLRLAATSDAILLLEDGVYAADTHFSHLFDATNAAVYVLEGDAKARGINDRINTEITSVNDAEFVDLLIKYTNSHSWY